MLNQVLLFIVFLAGILCLLIAGPRFLFHRDKPAAYFFMAMGLFFWGTSVVNFQRFSTPYPEVA